MKKKLVRLLCSLFAAVTLLSLFPVSALSYEGAPEVTSSAAVVFDLEAEEILYEKNMDGRLDPAAFTKLMTALLAYEYRSAKGNAEVTVTEEMLSSAGGTSMSLKQGEVIPFDSLLAGLVVQNANDAALVLASTVGGNISSFVELMNRRAEELGMENTYYSNPTGVDSATMYTTLRDVLTLCKAVYRINDFMLLSETPKVRIPATNLTEERVYTNKNALVPYSYVTDYYTEDVRGMVAGYTPRAGYCVATVREKKGSKNLVIVSGGTDRSERGNGTDISSYREAKALLEWAEGGFTLREAVAQGEVICECKVRLASGVDHMILVTGESLEKLLPTEADLSEKITTKVRTNRDTFTAPITQGSVYGEMEVFFEDELIGTVPLVARSNIGLSRWLVVWDAIKSFFSHGPAKVVLILVVGAAIFYVLYLSFSLWLQYFRATRERRRVINELMEEENQRLKVVRLKEREENQARMRKVRSAFRAGFQVLQGEEELPVAKSGKKHAPYKAVAKVPEKYRTARPASQSGRPASTQKRPVTQKRSAPPAGQREQSREVYRTARPVRRPPADQRPRQSRGQEPRRPEK